MTHNVRRVIAIALMCVFAVGVSLFAETWKGSADFGASTSQVDEAAAVAGSLARLFDSEITSLLESASSQFRAGFYSQAAGSYAYHTLSHRFSDAAFESVSITTPDRFIVFSTDEDRIGTYAAESPGAMAASQGNVFAEQVAAAASGDAATQSDAVSYVHAAIPVLGESSAVVGILEFIASARPIVVDQPGILYGRILAESTALFAVMLLIFRFGGGLLPNVERPPGSRRPASPVAGAPGSRAENDHGDVANRIKSRFLATMSHEIRTPMNAVVGMADLLKLTDLTRKQKSYVHTIQSNGDMLLSLVDNVLDFSKLEAGTLILDNRDFDVVELVESVLEIMGFSAFSRGLELFSTLRHDMHLRVSADKRRLRQVLVNLVGNAVKYTETGYVSVETRTSRDAHGQVRLEFVVTDTGPGINEEIRKVIFEPFVTSASLDGQHHDGSGLGLTICKRLIEAMQGRIAIENIEGGGTRARFCVPVEVRDSVLGGDVKASARIPERVLIAHETDAAAQSIAAHLSAWGIISESTNRASDAVHRLRSAAAAGRGFDLAIIDSGLTREDPLLCVRRIREAGELENLPIVLLVPITSQLEYGEVSGLGGIRCLMKPILPIQLRYNVLKSMAVHVEQLGESRRTHRHVADDITVLIADDNVVNAQLLSGMLTAEGFDTDTVNDGESVVRALETRDYDLLLLDGQMPDMDGHVVAKEIRSRPEKYAHQPIIVAVTADTSDAYRELCFDVGMDGFMVKPVRMQKLRDGLSEWCTLIAEKRAASRIDDSIVCRALRMNIIERTGERDESFLDSYIGLFLKDTHERIDALVAAIDRRDTERLRRECHALKGACLEFGAERMIRYCEEITSAASSLDFSEASEALQRLDREFARLKPVYESASRDQLH